MTDAAPLLAARGVSKSFFGNPVLRDVSIALLPGRVHALLGENGAGKSTLINLLSGALPADGGSVEIDGQAVARMTPSEARQAGIAVVQQELSLTGQPVDRREHRARRLSAPVRPDRLPGAGRAGKVRLRARRPRRAAVDAGRRSAARPTADGRDRQGALSQAARADPRRADLVAIGDRDDDPDRPAGAAQGRRASPSSTSRIGSTR